MSVVTGRRKPGSRWLPSDTTAALAWQSYSDELCSGCGNPRSESMARENTGAYHADALRCHSCEAVVRATKRYKDNPDPEALYFSARLP